MTALIASRPVHATRFERMLLLTSAGIERFVEHRHTRRIGARGRSAAQLAVAEARADALAIGSVGLLPR